MDLLIFSGQSNMQGQTECLPKSNAAVPGAVEYRFADNALHPLCHPVGENLDENGLPFSPDFSDIPGAVNRGALLAAWENHTNMVPDFCRSYIRAATPAAFPSGTTDRVAAVHAAKGSTQIEYWLKGHGGYSALCRKSLAAIQKVQPEHIFFIWLQGESDALAGVSKEAYQQMLLRLQQDLQADLGIEKFGVIQVGRFANDARDDAIIAAQKAICAENPDFMLLTAVTEQLIHNPRYMNPFARGHYNCFGQRVIGTLAGRTLGLYRRGLCLCRK